MGYIEQMAFDSQERAYLEPPDDEPDNYDDRFGILSDMEYERYREELLCEKSGW